MKSTARTGEHGQREQPTGDEFPCGKREQIEVERPAEDGIGEAARRSCRGLRGVPEERQRGPLGLHGGAGGKSDDDGNGERDPAKHLRDRELYLVACDEDGVMLGQVVGVRPPERGEDAKEKEKRDHCESSEDAPFEAARLPEHGRVAERPEPEQVNPVGQRRAASEDDDGENGEDEEQNAAARPGGLCRQRPIDGFGQWNTPLCLLRGQGFRKPRGARFFRA